MLRAELLWELLWAMLNTVLASRELASPVENDMFPLPEKDDVRSNRETRVFSQNPTKNEQRQAIISSVFHCIACRS